MKNAIVKIASNIKPVSVRPYVLGILVVSSVAASYYAIKKVNKALKERTPGNADDKGVIEVEFYEVAEDN